MHANWMTLRLWCEWAILSKALSSSALCWWRTFTSRLLVECNGSQELTKHTTGHGHRGSCNPCPLCLTPTHTYTHTCTHLVTHSQQLQSPNQPNPPCNLSCFNLNKGEIIDVEMCMHVCVCVREWEIEREGFCYPSKTQLKVYTFADFKGHSFCLSLYYWVKQVSRQILIYMDTFQCVCICGSSDDSCHVHQQQLMMDSVATTRWSFRIYSVM